MATIVQINFDYDDTSSELSNHASEVAPKFLNIDGLLWKIWLNNEEQKTTGGIYLFDTKAAAESYVESDLVSGIKKKRKNVLVKIFDVLDEPSSITNAPVTQRHI